MRSGKTLFLSLFSFFSFVFITIMGCSKQEDQDNIIARAGNDYAYTFNDLKEYVEEWMYDRKFRDKSEAYSNALDSMLTNNMKRVDFFERGLDKNDELIQSIHRTINEEMVTEYYSTQYLGKYSSDESAKKAYGIMDRQVTYQQVFLKFPKNANAKQKESLRNQAEAVKNEIKSGKDFGKIVKQYSKDSTTLALNGVMRPIEWEQSLSDQIANMIFKLNKGDIRVIESADGFIVVKVIDTMKVPLAPYDKIKNEIKQKLIKIYSDKSVEDFDNDKEALVDVKNVNCNNKALSIIAQWSRDPKFYLNMYYKDTLQNYISKNNLTVLTYPNGKVDFKELLRLFNDVLLPKSADYTKEEDVKKYVLEAVRTGIIVKKAEALGLREKIFNAKTKNPVIKNKIAFLYNQAVIESQIPAATEDALQKFYNEQKDSIYYQLQKVNIYTLVYSDENKAKEAMQKIKSGMPFEKIAERFFVKTFIRERNGEIKLFMSKDEPLLGDEAFKLKLNEVKGPVEYIDATGKQYAIIKCVNIRPEKQLTYDEAKKTIVADFRNNKRQIIKKGVREQLWKKYKVEVFYDVLAKKLNEEN